MASYDTDDFVALATGKAQLQQNIDWGKLFETQTLRNIAQYCEAHYTEVEYVVVPYFAMCSAVTGKQTIIDSGLLRPGRTNLYLLVSQGTRISSTDYNIVLDGRKPQFWQNLWF